MRRRQIADGRATGLRNLKVIRALDPNLVLTHDGSRDHPNDKYSESHAKFLYLTFTSQDIGIQRLQQVCIPVCAG